MWEQLGVDPMTLAKAPELDRSPDSDQPYRNGVRRFLLEEVSLVWDPVWLNPFCRSGDVRCLHGDAFARRGRVTGRRTVSWRGWLPLFRFGFRHIMGCVRVLSAARSKGRLEVVLWVWFWVLYGGVGEAGNQPMHGWAVYARLSRTQNAFLFVQHWAATFDSNVAAQRCNISLEFNQRFSEFPSCVSPF